MKICPVGADLFHADGQTDMTRLKVVFRNFANAPKKRAPNMVVAVFVHPSVRPPLTRLNRLSDVR